MDPTQLIADYGPWFYAITFLWTFVHGQSFLLLAGFAAQHGYLRLDLLILTAWAGSFLSDELCFHAARHAGPWLRRRLNRAEPMIDRCLRLLARHSNAFVLSYRYLYGLRNLAPLALGLSSLGWARYLILNALGAALWAIGFGGGGYLFGQAIDAILTEHLRSAGIGVLVVVGLAVLARWLWLRRRAAAPN